MLKEGVRLDRVRGGRQKYRRMLDSPYTSSAHMLGHQRPILTLDGMLAVDPISKPSAELSVHMGADA